MPRKPKPYPHRGHYVSEAGGVRRVLCPLADGYEAACAKLAELLEADRLAEEADPRSVILRRIIALRAELDELERFVRKHL